MMWAEAYKGNFSIVHKLMLTREVCGVSDEVMNQFIMAYVYYRMGDEDKIEPIIEGIDAYLEHKFGLKNK